MLDTHIHHHYYGNSKKVNKKLSIIIKNQMHMNDQLQELKASLEDSKAKVAKVSADVDNLTSKLNAVTGTLPTPEEWAEVVGLANELNTSLQVVDDKTADETAAPAAEQQA